MAMSAGWATFTPRPANLGFAGGEGLGLGLLKVILLRREAYPSWELTTLKREAAAESSRGLDTISGLSPPSLAFLLLRARRTQSRTATKATRAPLKTPTAMPAARPVGRDTTVTVVGGVLLSVGTVTAIAVSVGEAIAGGMMVVIATVCSTVVLTGAVTVMLLTRWTVLVTTVVGPVCVTTDLEMTNSKDVTVDVCSFFSLVFSSPLFLSGDHGPPSVATRRVSVVG